MLIKINHVRLCHSLILFVCFVCFFSSNYDNTCYTFLCVFYKLFFLISWELWTLILFVLLRIWVCILCCYVKKMFWWLTFLIFTWIKVFSKLKISLIFFSCIKIKSHDGGNVCLKKLFKKPHFFALSFKHYFKKNKITCIKKQ